METSRSLTLWDGISWIPWSFWHALSSSLVAASTSLAVTWYRVNWVIDFARRLTAASFIGVGWAILPGRIACSVFCRRGAVERSICKSPCCQLFRAQAWGSALGNHSMADEHIGWNGVKRQQIPWLDVLWHRPTLPETTKNGKKMPLKKVTTIPSPFFSTHAYKGKLTTSLVTKAMSVKNANPSTPLVYPNQRFR